MPYTVVTKEQFIQYFEKTFKTDLKVFLKEYMGDYNAKLDGDSYPGIYRILYPRNQKLVLYSSKSKGYNTPENANMFVTSVYYLCLIYYVLDQYANYWFYKKVHKTPDPAYSFSSKNDIPMLAADEWNIMNPTTAFKQFGFFIVGKMTAKSMLETLENTKIYFLDNVERFCKGCISKNHFPEVIFIAEKMIDIQINKLKTMSSYYNEKPNI